MPRSASPSAEPKVKVWQRDAQIWGAHPNRCMRLAGCVIDLNDGYCHTCRGFVDPPNGRVACTWGVAWPREQAVKGLCVGCRRRRLVVYGLPGDDGVLPGDFCRTCWEGEAT